MALAFLELRGREGGDIVFAADCGTNTAYRLELGARFERAEDGSTRMVEVFHRREGRADGAHAFAAPLELRVPARLLRRGQSYAQLLSWKDAGRAPAASDVVDLRAEAAMAGIDAGPLTGRALSLADTAAARGGAASTALPRQVPHRREPVARATSLDALIGEIVKIAAPLVTQLLQAGHPGGGMGGVSGNAPGGMPLQGLMQVLQAVLGAVGGGAAGTPLATPHSLRPARGGVGDNRFAGGDLRRIAEPLIFGIDDALIASLVGPVLQLLPQLMNAANTRRIELKKADNALMAGIVSDVQKRLMMDKLLQAQRSAQAQGPAADIKPEQIEAVLALLGKLPGGADTPPPDPAQGSQPAGKALSMATAVAAAGPAPRPRCRPSDRAVLAFEFAPAHTWSGAERPLFRRGQDIVLQPRLVVAANAPKSPLPRAILRVVLRDAEHPATRIEKSWKLHDVHAGTVLECRFEAAELAPLPTQARIAALAQLRWPQGADGRETRCATGAAEIVFVEGSFLRARGAELEGEREPADMQRFRSFWNKVWEAPAGGAEAGRRLWELDVQARLTALLDDRHPRNALMQTRLLATADEPGALRARTQGRMKAGIELSLAELNGLLPLWAGRTPLADADLAALAARPMLAEAARETLCRLRLKGRLGRAGMVWVLPTFRLHGFTFSDVAAVDPHGQVSATTEREAAFPMPAAMRTIGLTATT